MSKQPFNESLSPGCVDPTACGHCDFDYETVIENLDGPHGDTPACPAMLEAVNRLMDMLVEPDCRLSVKTAHAVGLRCLSLAWVLDPARYPGTPSAKKLARQLGVSYRQFIRLTGGAARAIGWHNRAQVSAWNWKPAEAGADVCTDGKESSSPTPRPRVRCQPRPNA